MLPEIGLPELLLIGVVALLVLKPEDIPTAMHKLGVLSATLRCNLNGLLQGCMEKAGQQQLLKKPPASPTQRPIQR